MVVGQSGGDALSTAQGRRHIAGRRLLVSVAALAAGLGIGYGAFRAAGINATLWVQDKGALQRQGPLGVEHVVVRDSGGKLQPWDAPSTTQLDLAPGTYWLVQDPVAGCSWNGQTTVPNLASPATPWVQVTVTRGHVVNENLPVSWGCP